MPISRAKEPQLQYEGSVKRVWQAPDSDRLLWFEFTDDFSVFDWGKMPDTIKEKGRSLAAIGAHIFGELENSDFWSKLKTHAALKKFNQAWLAKRFQHPIFSSGEGLAVVGLGSNFVRLTGQDSKALDLSDIEKAKGPIYFEVQRAEVNRPEPRRILGQTAYFYPDSHSNAKLRMVPLEVVFRFGMTAGSSLVDRIKADPGYAAQLGIKNPVEGQFFERPVLEFFTKLEPKDRLLSLQEAAELSGLSGYQFECMTELAISTALGLHALFEERGLELWDGKLEFAAGTYHPEDKDSLPVIMLADAIGPDELRLMYKGAHLSKELLRRFYRGTEWYDNIVASQKTAREKGGDWKEIYLQNYKVQPERMPEDVKEHADLLYPVLANRITGQEVFAGVPSLDEFVEDLPEGLTGGKHK